MTVHIAQSFGIALVVLIPGLALRRTGQEDDAELIELSQQQASVHERNGLGAGLSQDLASAAALSATLVSYARSLPRDSATRQLFESLQICGTCSNFKRFGEAADGGYLTCMDGIGSTVSALSLGVEHHDKWSDDVTRELEDVRVAQFDCTVDTGPDCSGKCSFHKACLVSKDNHESSTLSPLVTLDEAIKLSLPSGMNEASDRTILMKMDIEAAEWPILDVEPRETLKKLNQAILEFHWLDRTDQHPKYAQAIRNLLDAGLKVVHLHGNNNGGMYTVEPGLSIPNVLEVTFVADAPDRQGHCLLGQEYIPELDAKNKLGAPELPMASFKNLER